MMILAMGWMVACGADEGREAVWEAIEAGALVVDVRTKAEFESGHLEGAIHVPYERTAELAAAIGEDKQRAVVVYCRTGRRSGIAREALAKLGYVNIINGGGYDQLRLHVRPSADQDNRPARTD